MKKMGAVVKNWKKRYFILYAHKLEYYATSGLKGVITISDVSQVRRPEKNTRAGPLSKDSLIRCHFQLVTAERVYAFCCESNAEREVVLVFTFV